MINLLLKALSPDAVKFAVKYLARPALYLICVLVLIGFHNRKVEEAVSANDARWKAQIATSNAEVAQRQVERTVAAAQLSARLADQTARAESLQSELEKANAALPNATACGLDRNRARLLREP
jgi:hypothetical protein